MSAFHRFRATEPTELGWAFVAIAALLLGVLPSIIVGLSQ